MHDIFLSVGTIVQIVAQTMMSTNC